MFQKRTSIAVASLLLLISTLWAAGPAVPEDPTWKKVRDAMDRGLPKTAIKELNPLIEKALAEENHDAAVRGIATRVVLESNIQGNQPAEKVNRMEAEIAKAPDEITPVLEVILAHWYWSYFQQNRWRFANRTEVDAAGESDKDFTTWDLARILTEIDRHFSEGLKAVPALQKITASDYHELLKKGTVGNTYRPTLYDVLAESAITFYSAGEQGGSKSQDAFELQTESPIFDSLQQFLDWKPESSDDRSPTLRAIELYQDLLRFHTNDADSTALLDWDLARYRFGFNHAVGQSSEGQSKDECYKNSMRRFASEHKDHRTSSRALHNLATLLHSEKESVEAHQLATEGMNRFPDSVGSRRCFNLIQQIEAKSASIQTERVWNNPLPTIDVSHRNVDRIYFRLLSYDYVEFLKSKRFRPDQVDQNELKRLLAQQPTRSWSADLPPTDDFQQRVESVNVPADIPLGPYLLLTSHDEDFSDVENQVSITEIWRSDLALVTRNHQSKSLIDGFVLDAKSGQPIANADVQVWRRERDNRMVKAETISTDAKGRFQITKNSKQQFQLLVKHNKDFLGSTHRLHLRNGRRNLAMDHSRTVFFTDRALYRPGQTIQYKGVCYWANTYDNDYRTLAGQNVTVVFTDANGQEIEKRTHRCNDYGSFSGSVTAPRNRLMGQMNLRIQSGPRGQTSIRVEEYKRPKFRVEVKSPEKNRQTG